MISKIDDFPYVLMPCTFFFLLFARKIVFKGWEILSPWVSIVGMLQCLRVAEKDAVVNPWLIHVNVWQKPLQYCKVISLQRIKINGIEEKIKKIN